MMYDGGDDCMGCWLERYNEINRTGLTTFIDDD